jgi:hypothetical protein
LDLELVWDLIIGIKTALFRHFSTFFQSSSPTILLQQAEKLTKNFSFLAQTPNPKQALMISCAANFQNARAIMKLYEFRTAFGNPFATMKL